MGGSTALVNDGFVVGRYDDIIERHGEEKYYRGFAIIR